MRRRTMRGALHLLLGGAAAAALVAIGTGMTLTVLRSQGATRWLTIALVIASALLVGRLLVTPAVRPVESTLARLLLDAEVPELEESQDRQARFEGAMWAGITLLTGGVCLFLLLLLVPSGLALGVDAASGARLVVAGRSYTPNPVVRLLLVVLGIGLLIAAVAAQPLGVALLRRWAPTWLRPSGDELLAAERRRGDELARSNAVARDLHDSIGHALTAIGIQAEAALATGRAESITTIRDLAHKAVSDLDRALGVLRDTGDAPTHELSDLSRIPSAFPEGAVELTVTSEADLPAPVADAAYRIVQESVTNGARHGVLPVQAQILVTEAAARIKVTNAVGQGTVARNGRGLIGMRERAASVGGSLHAGLEGEVWCVRAELPGVNR